MDNQIIKHYFFVFFCWNLISCSEKTSDYTFEIQNFIDQREYKKGGDKSISVSRKSGFYPTNFKLIISSKEKGQLFYTLNGKLPRIGSSYTFKVDSGISTEKLKVEKIEDIPTTSNIEDKHPWKKSTGVPIEGYSIRVARIFKDSILDEKTFNYIINEILCFKPVESVLINIDRNCLFHKDSGIYVFGNSKKGNFEFKGLKGEKLCTWEYFDKSGFSVKSLQSKLSIHGLISRRNSQKSLKLKSIKKNGIKRFNYSFFKNGPKKFKKLILRSASSGWGSGIYKDCIASEFATGLNFEVGKQKPVAVFINGKYWGVHFLSEKIDRHYLQENFKENPQEVSIVRDNLNADHGDSEAYRRAINYAKILDFGIELNYKSFKSLVDINSYIDWFISETFFQNKDWPCNNTKLWTSKKSTKWRNFLIDLDACFSEPHKNYLERAYGGHIEEGDQLNRCNFLIRNLMRNKGFRNKFNKRAKELLVSTFSHSKLKPIVDKYHKTFQHPAFSYWHFKRWNDPVEEEFHSFQINLIDWVKNRQDYYLKHLSIFMEDGKRLSKSSFVPFKM